MPTVNTHPVEPGCYIAGHWGQYGPDRLADIAEGFGWTPEKSTDDPRIIREFNDAMLDANRNDYLLGEWTVDAADAIEDWLRDHTLPICPHCGRDMTGTSDGFYRHVDYPSAVMAERIGCVAACDSPHFPLWEWIDGEFYLALYDSEGEYIEP